MSDSDIEYEYESDLGDESGSNYEYSDAYDSESHQADEDHEIPMEIASDAAAATSTPSSDVRQDRTQKDIQRVMHGTMSSKQRQECIIVDFMEMKNEMLKVVRDTCEVLCLSLDDVLILLGHFSWDEQKLKSQWFDNEEKLRQVTGVSAGDPPTRPEGVLDMCPVTLEDDIPYTECDALPCEHWISDDAWREYLADGMNSGPLCTHLTCPFSDCNERVRRRLFKKFCDKTQLRTYDSYLVQGFVDRNPHAKFCPAPDCKYMSLYSGGGPYDVVCLCGQMYCFSCLADAHRPTSCEDVKRWNIKNSSESENTEWIMANTKPCPKCGINIEKNQGCNHMTCRQVIGGCGYEFCWLCLGDWQVHNSSTGGFYACNRYNDKSSSTVSKLRDLEAAAANARQRLDRYMHYFSRFQNHDSARRTTLRLKEQVKSVMDQLQSKHGLSFKDVECLETACNLLLEARRVLKWTYVFGYYCDNPKELSLFEFLQQQLEENMEHLQELIELNHSASSFLEMEDPNELERIKFFEYLKDVRNYTGITQKFMQEMLSGVENGLVDDTPMMDVENNTEQTNKVNAESDATNLNSKSNGKRSNSIKRVVTNGKRAIRARFSHNS